jgi:hypothetical protein
MVSGRGSRRHGGVRAGSLFLWWVGKLPGFVARMALIFAHLARCADGRGEPPGDAFGHLFVRMPVRSGRLALGRH